MKLRHPLWLLLTSRLCSVVSALVLSWTSLLLSLSFPLWAVVFLMRLTLLQAAPCFCLSLCFTVYCLALLLDGEAPQKGGVLVHMIYLAQCCRIPASERRCM